MEARSIEAYRQGLCFSGGALNIAGTRQDQNRRPGGFAFKDVDIQGRTEPVGGGARITEAFPEIKGKRFHGCSFSKILTKEAVPKTSVLGRQALLVKLP
jgi:hypothetical protein